MFKRLIWMILIGSLLNGCRTQVHEEGMPDQVSEQAQPSDIDTLSPDSAQAVTNIPPPEMEEPVSATTQTALQERKDIMVLLKTSEGDIKIQLDRESAPKTVSNFLSYVEEGHYDGTIFHRVINGFMIQGGGFNEAMNQKKAPRTVENEADNGLHNVVGSVAMARTPDPHSASAQFFINVNDNAFLDYPGQDGWGYCVFGKVVEGMDVVEAIKKVRTRTVGPHRDVPAEPVLIESASVVEE